MLNELIEGARALLQARPMDDTAYFQWSDRARQMIAGAYGAESPEAREFFKARWEISTSATSDPSMYLTQIGANLRRELRALEKFERQGGPPESAAAAASAAATTAGRVLVVGGREPGAIAAIVADLGFEPIEVAAKDRAALTGLASSPLAGAIAAALVVVEAASGSRGARARPDIESVFDLGVLTGALGPDRVAALVGRSVTLPGGAGAVRSIALGDAGALSTELGAYLGELEKTG